jgi:hypothetical protein
MGERVRTQLGSALPTGKQGAPGPGGEVDRESMSPGIRTLILAWGQGPELRDDDERLAAIRKGPRFVAVPDSAEPRAEG